MHEQQQRYYQNEPDPFDLFEMFFNGQGTFQFNDGRVYRRQRRQENANNQPQGYRLLIYQLFPFLIFILLYIIPIIFQSSPMWEFEKSNDYYIKKTTPNGATFFANEKFETKYQFESMYQYEKEKLFNEIDYEYLRYLEIKCSKVMKIKQDLQYKLYYYQGYPKYVKHFQSEIDKLDFSYCHKYTSFSQVVR